MKINILASIRTGRTFKCISAFVAISILTQCISPTVAFALTSGPGQEEFASFEPATTTDMVDLYSGDFNYNIPLLSVPGPNGGYPINLAYHSGVGMEQEASWVGLGWNLNVGAINRQLRGLPDDFQGDQITQKMSLKQNTTVGIDISGSKQREFFGIPKPSKDDNPSTMQWQIYYNTYKGLGYRVFFNPARESKSGVSSVGVGISYDSQEGSGLEPNMSLQGESNSAEMGYRLGVDYNSRSGVQSFSFSSSLSLGNKTKNNARKEGNDNSGSVQLASSSSISYAVNQSVPGVSIPMRTDAYPFQIKFGSEKTFGTFESRFPIYWSGFVSNSKVAYGGVVNTSAYGYLHTAEASDESMKDFQRENITYSKNVPNLAPSSFTYDLFTQTGQGTGSMFRPYYSSVGILSDAKKKSIEKQYRLNFEGAATPPNYHLGIGYTPMSGSTSSGSWETGNELANALAFQDNNGDPNYEPYYFQQYGEKTGVLLAHDHLEKWGGDEAVRAEITKTSNWADRQFEAAKSFRAHETGVADFVAGFDQNYRKSRQARASNIEILTDEQAQAYGGKQEQYGYTKAIPGETTSPNKVFGHGSKISEISMLQPDGMRYTYGLPAYNTYQMDALFSVDGQSAINNNNINVPNNGTDITPYDGNITDKFLSETIVEPDYAHSWMLTSVVSSDYIDLTGDGPTDDDYGYWVKFNYEKTAKDYRWRVPFKGGNYMVGHRNERSDDKASFTYGEKEIFFLKSIETKTHIAVFNTNDRKDGLEAYGKLDAAPTRTQLKMKCLEKIRLFTKNEYYLNKLTKEEKAEKDRTPIKEAHFVYSYSLCKNIPNSIDGGGKLTLERLFFSYQNSRRGEFSPYKFGYGDITSQTDNPNYNDKRMDRWGNFKEDGTLLSNYPYLDFPYTRQEDLGPTNKAPNVAVWSLKKIELPTGGTIRVNYESDDYAYVEDKKATHMFDIVSVGQQPTDFENRDNSTPIKKHTELHTSGDNGNTRVYFKLDRDISGDSDPDKYKYVAAHINGISKIYFKTFAKLTMDDVKSWDYVSGYADIVMEQPEDVGWVSLTPNGGGPTKYYGYVTVKAVDLKKHSIRGQTVSPFTKAAIQYLRTNRPELIYNETGTNSNDAKSQIKNLMAAIPNHLKDLMSAIQGFNTWALSKGFGKTIQLDGRSIIRLADPDGKKYGGGVRVSRVSINDNWDATNQDITNASIGGMEYGQKYDYTINEGGKVISSGVAYEPTVGGDESALRTPIEYEESIPLGTSGLLYIDKPLMESYYPGASVGYRKVTVSSIGSEQAALKGVTINRTKAPLTIYEFYSPKDFPVDYDETFMSADPSIIRPIIIPGIYTNFKKRKARSQGYSVLLNDMAGKLKSIAQRTSATETNPDGSLISKEEYIYNTVSPYSEDRKNKLSDKVQVVALNPTNPAQTMFQTAVVGQSHDVFIDMNENVQKSKTRGIDGNLDLKYAPPTVLIPVIALIPYFSDVQTSLKTVVTVKVIYRSGILKKVISTKEQSVVTTENLAFDLQTGAPLLTKVTNEFEDPIYQQSYPAHWYYATMGGAYKNFGFYTNQLTNGGATTSNGGLVQLNAANTYFNEGDELWVNSASTPFKAHVYEVGSNFIKLVKRDGGYVAVNVTDLRVITSGRKNLLTSEVGKVVSKEIIGFNEIQSLTPIVYSFNVNKILDASSIEYKNRWDVICNNCGSSQPTGNTPKDAFITGERGIWRPYKNYVYKANRVYTAGNEKSRTNGTFEDFAYFPWHNPATKSAKWIEANTITLYSPYGYELENKDAIGNYSSALYGYNQSLTTAVAKNAQYQEIGFESFEDYDLLDCQDHQFKFENNKTKITETEKHSGKSSMRLKPGEKVAVDVILKNCQQQ